MTKNKIIKSIMVVTSGTAFAQILNIVFSPVITRIYSPEEYGVYITFTSLVGLLSLNGFKYELAIPITKKNSNAYNLLVLSCSLLLFFTIFLFVFLLIFNDLLSYFNFPTLQKYWYILPIGIFTGGLYAIFTQWSYRLVDYKKITRTLMTQSVLSNLTKTGFGLGSIGPLGLLIGHVVGISAGIGTLYKNISKYKVELLHSLNFKEILFLLKRYKDFPAYNIPSFILMSFGSVLPIIFLGIEYSSSVVGLFGLAYTIVKLPMNVIGKSVSDVFLAEAAKMGTEKALELKKLWNQILYKLAFVGIIPLIILLFFGPFLFELIFGNDWRVAGEFAQILSFLVFFMLIFSPSLKIFIIFERQRMKLILDLFRVVLVIFTFTLVSIFNWSPVIAATLYSFAISLDFTIKHIVARYILNKHIERK